MERTPVEELTEAQVLQIIGQLEASINKVEPYLSTEDFRDYCDSTYSSIAMWRVVLKKVRTAIEKPNAHNWEEMK